MNLSDIRTDADLRNYVLQLIEQKDQEKLILQGERRSNFSGVQADEVKAKRSKSAYLLSIWNDIKHYNSASNTVNRRIRKSLPKSRRQKYRVTAYPSLLAYLLSLWATAEKYKDVEKISYALIAQILEEAFSTPPKDVSWTVLLADQYLPTYDSEPNTSEYYLEIRKYEHFERAIRNYVISRKMLMLYSFKQLGIPDYAEGPEGEWGKYCWESHTVAEFLERGTYLIDEDDGSDPNYPITWYSLYALISAGRYEQ